MTPDSISLSGVAAIRAAALMSHLTRRVLRVSIRSDAATEGGRRPIVFRKRRRLPKVNRKRSCLRKVAHSDRDGAESHAERLNHHPYRSGLWVPYRCRFCGRWHVGRAVPTPPDLRLDVALWSELGDRAYYCGLLESFGTPAARRRAVRQRSNAAGRRRSRGC